MYSHITAGSAVNVYAGSIRKVKLQVNGALTGTITLADEIGTTGSPVIAVITNPTVGSVYEYWTIVNGLSVTPSATCDITVSLDLSRLGTAL